ncbi:MAG: transporter [Caldithrix sp.]|nr:transporter [Caldithrix sp.]
MQFTDFLQNHQVILLFLIITLGYLFGRIKIWGFSFEATGILFVAMIFGNYGFTLLDEFQKMGLILFIYAIGLQAGPAIFNISRKQGLRINLLVIILLGSGALITYVSSYIWNIDMQLAIGLFAGAMTSTPGLASAQETTGSALTSTGYGVAYPFGVIGVILFIKLLPYIFKVDIRKEEEQENRKQRAGSQKVIHKHVRITSETLDGKTLGELNFSRMTGTVISRLKHDGEVRIPSPELQLHVGDVVRLVGEKSRIETAIPFMGEVTDEPIPTVQYFESRMFVVTNKDMVGKSIAELNLPAMYNVNITRIRRGGLEFTAEPDQRLNWGDRVRIAGDAAHMTAIRNLLGDEMKKIEYGDIFAIIAGILIGIGIGLIPFSLGKAISLNLGVTGGVLIAGIILSNRVKLGPIIWQVPMPIISLIRDLGLTMFLAVVGIKAGSEVITTVQQQGIKLILIGVVITLMPMIIITLIARFKYRIYLIEMVGMLSGGMTSTPGLAAGAGITESQAPLLMYATVYPFAMILMMIFVKILAVL